MSDEERAAETEDMHAEWAYGRGDVAMMMPSKRSAPERAYAAMARAGRALVKGAA